MNGLRRRIEQEIGNIINALLMFEERPFAIKGKQPETETVLEAIAGLGGARD